MMLKRPPQPQTRTHLSLAIAIALAALCSAPRALGQARLSSGEELGLARAEARQGHYARALSLYDQVLAQAPDNYDALQGKAFVLYWTHHFGESQAIFERLARVNPSDSENGTALRAIARAMDAARWAAMRPGSSAPPQAWMGYYISYLADHPGDKAAIEGLARAEAQLGIYDVAVRNDQHALRLDPADTSTQEHMARVLSWNRQYAASVEAYNELLRKEPDNREALQSLARVDEWAGRLPDALAVEKRLLALDPASTKYQQAVVRLELDVKDEGAAWQALTRMLHGHPQDRWALLQLAEIEERQGHLLDALSYFDAILADNFNDADALYNEARIFYFLGNPERAYPLAARAVDERPNDFDALVLDARLERARHRSNRALALLRRAALLNPASPEVKSLEAAVENDYKVDVHTSSTYAREFGSEVFAPGLPARPVEDLNAYSSAVRTNFSVLPRSDSYVLVATTPSNSPRPGTFGTVAPGEVLYGQTARISSLLTLRGGAGAVRLGPATMIDVSTSPFERPFPAPRPGIVPVGYFGLSVSPAKRLAVDFTASRVPINYTPTSVRFAVIDTRLEAGVRFNFSARTSLAATYAHHFVSSSASYQSIFFPRAYIPFEISFLGRGGSDQGNEATLTLDRNIIRGERISLDAGYTGRAFGYAGERRGVYMGFYNPELYQAHYLTAHAAGAIAGPFRFNFTADVGVQQAHVPASLAPFARAVELEPGASIRVSRRLIITLGYTHYDFSQSLGSVRGNAVEIDTDWRF